MDLQGLSERIAAVLARLEQAKNDNDHGVVIASHPISPNATVGEVAATIKALGEGTTELGFALHFELGANPPTTVLEIRFAEFVPDYLRPIDPPKNN